MKKILISLFTLSFSTTTFLNSHLNESLSTFLKIQENVSDWNSIDLSKFKIDHHWDNNNIQNNDININLPDFENGSGLNIQQNIYMQIAKVIDNKYINIEWKLWKKNTLFNDIAKQKAYFSMINITILNKINYNYNNKIPFKSFNINNKNIASFNLRISNNLSTDWSTNKSYFDISVNICNFDIGTIDNNNFGRLSTLADKETNLNTSMLPDTNQTSSTKVSTVTGDTTLTASNSYSQNNISSHKDYGSLHHEYSNKMSFSEEYIYSYTPYNYTFSPNYVTANWKGDPNNSNTPGHIDLEKICPQFTNINVAKYFLGNISITSDYALEDWCTPNSNSGKRDNANKVVNLTLNDVKDYDDIYNDETLPWNKTPDTNIKNNEYYIPDSQYDKKFKKHLFQKKSGHIYYAAFMALANSNLNSHTIDAFGIFSWTMPGTVYAGIKLKFAIHSKKIEYSFNSAIFKNNPS